MALIYVEPDDRQMLLYKKLIKDQGVTTCRDQLSMSVISSAVDSFLFGFLHVSKKAQVGRRRLSPRDDFQINGFIFCTFVPSSPHELTIQLICASKQSHLGKVLMQAVENKAKTMNVSSLRLHCLDNRKLRTWYESLGFTYQETIYLKPEVPKVFLYRKELDYSTMDTIDIATDADQIAWSQLSLDEPTSTVK